jgi:small subunit ribosomal protein S21
LTSKQAAVIFAFLTISARHAQHGGLFFGRRYIPLVEVIVRDNNVDQALRALKKKMQREGLFREMKMRRHYEKPSEARVREAAEAQRRARKLARKQSERND